MHFFLDKNMLCWKKPFYFIYILWVEIYTMLRSFEYSSYERDDKTLTKLKRRKNCLPIISLLSLLSPIMEHLILATDLQLNRWKIYITCHQLPLFFPLSLRLPVLTLMSFQTRSLVSSRKNFPPIFHYTLQDREEMGLSLLPLWRCMIFVIEHFFFLLSRFL